MKKMKLIFLLAVLTSFASNAQSKFSYSFLTNTSGSLDDQVGICILRTTGGQCYDLEKSWKINFTAAANYRVSERFRLQSGLGYNVLHMDQLNEALNTSRYQIKYLSIPIKAHYFISKGKLRFYIGGGFRTDIRINKQRSVFGGALVQDNGGGMAVSFETLLGLEFNVLPMFSFGVEPTYSTAVTSYSGDLKFGSSSLVNSFARSFALINLIDEYPDRLGMTFSVNYKFK